MTRAAPFALALALSFLLAPAVRAGGGDEAPKKDDPKPSGAPARPKGEASDGPEIAWARSYAEAREEAAERNVAIYLHSHGST